MESKWGREASRTVWGQSLFGAGRRPTFNTYLALAAIVFSILLLILIPYEIEKPKIILGQSTNALDPALFPLVVAATTLILGLWYLRESFRLEEENQLLALDRAAWVDLGVTLAALLIYATLLVPIGFIPSSILLIGGLAVFLGARNIAVVIAVSVTVPVSIYYLFTRALKVSLPEIPDL